MNGKGKHLTDIILDLMNKSQEGTGNISFTVV